MAPVSIALTLVAAALAAWAAAAWAIQARRARALAAAGEAVGLRFDAVDPFNLPESHSALALLARGHSRLAWNVLHGRRDGLSVRLCDYQYETGRAGHRRSHRYQVALVHGELDWPALLCQPADQRDPADECFGLAEVPFAVEPFASRFRVASESADFAFSFLHSELADLLAANPLVTVQTCGDTLAIWRAGLAASADAVGLLDLACRIHQSAPPALREELRSTG